METLLLAALACGLGFVVFIAPNVITVGALSALSLVPISIFCWRDAYSPGEAIMLIVLGIATFQLMFFGSIYISNEFLSVGRVRKSTQNDNRLK